MKIGEARQVYTEYYNRLREQKALLKKSMEECQEGDDTGVILELSGQVDKKLEEVTQFLRFDLIELTSSMENAVLLKDQQEAIQESAEDEMKCMETARRIAAGDKVPAQDEKKLMDYNYKLYLSAKNAAILNEMKEHKEYDSLWEDDEKREPTDMEALEEAIDDSELTIAAPEMDIEVS